MSRSKASNNGNIDLLLTTEGTYPTSEGGVSTWCDALVSNIPGVSYDVLTILGNPYDPNKYDVPPAVKLIRVPLWGMEDPTEHLEVSFSDFYNRKLRTNRAVIEAEFLPALDRLMAMLFAPGQPGTEAAAIFYSLYQLFGRYDYMTLFQSPVVWEFFTSGIRNGRWVRLPEQPSVNECLQALAWLYRFLIVLNQPLRRYDVVHSSAAAFCGLPGVIAKHAYGTPFLLTEHGVYLREQYLSVGRSGLPPFGKRFLLSFVRAVVSANYDAADVVAPVCAFNARWERRFGVEADKIEVIYNGVRPEQFGPGNSTTRRRAEGQLTFVTVARVDPVKDLLTLIRAAAAVHEQLPQAKFVIYGSVSVPAYYQRCLALREELGLEKTVIFAGHTADVASAYQGGDVVVLTSITEGFPYAVIEAMMSGRPIIATDVGGTGEALGDAGLLVDPGNWQQLAENILKLSNDPRSRQELASEARERALTYFTLDHQLNAYGQLYGDLVAERVRLASETVAGVAADPATGDPDEVAASLTGLVGQAVDERRQLAADRAAALQAMGDLEAAGRELRLAIDVDPAGPGTPLLILQLAGLHLELGDFEQCWLEMERAEALAGNQEEQVA